MKKLFTFLFALLVTSNLWATIIYEKNGGKFNDYDWTSKADMFAAFMTDAGATGFETLDYYKASDSPLKGSGICSKMTTPEKAFENQAKWGWLKDYIRTVQNAQTGAPTLDDTGKGSTWYYAVGAFFVEMKLTSWPYSADFTEAGKDAAYIPAWGQNYGNPTDPTGVVTLVEPYRAGYLFDGWYASADFSGEKVTIVDQNTTGTLYAKWVLDGIVYELNGGVWNEYGWNNKSDMFAACMAEAGVTGLASLDDLKAAGTASLSTICTPLNATKCQVILDSEKWEWLEQYIMSVQNPQKGTIVGGGAIAELKANTADAGWRFAIAAFFLEMQNTAWPRTADFSEAGKDAAYIPAWGQSYGNPEHPTEEVTLHTPFKEGYKFLGWYDNEACTGTPVTKVDQNYKGTLYAKWVLDGIVYELNGGVWNEYGWNNKSDMFAVCMAEAGVTGLASLDDLKAAGTSSLSTICTPLNATKCQVILDSDKWEWLEQYIMSVQNPQKGTIVGGGAIAELTANTADAGWRFAIAAFFLEMQNTAWPRTADFSEAGKDAAYIPAWGQSYGNPEHPTEEVTLVAPYKPRYNFEGWYDNAECTGTAITTVDENYAGTLYAKWSLAPVLYNLNGGQYNEYGWESKKDVYDDFIADWNTYSGTTRKTAQYEDQLGIGKSNEGIPTTITTVNGVNHRDNLASMFTNPTYSAKWGWLATYIDAVATQQSKTQPTTDANKLTFSLGNFFGEDNNHAADYIGAVDFTGDARYLVSARLSCSFTLPNPTYPTSEVTINNPTKEGYIFDGWYANADLSGAKVTKVNADTKGTLYAKWTEKVIIIDDKAVNSTALAEYNGQIVTAKVTRAFNNDSYKTLTLPFDMNEEQIKAVFGETAIVHEFTSVGEANDMFYLHFEQTTPAIIEAGKPYIIKLPETGDYDAKDGFTIEGVTINTTPNPVVQGAITMKPILDGGGRLDQASQYWLASDNYLYSAGAHPTALLGLRAYFINSTGRPIRARVVYGENEATSIPTVVAPEDNVRKVLKDGQIIIIRGEKQYNIQGQVIE